MFEYALPIHPGFNVTVIKSGKFLRNGENGDGKVHFTDKGMYTLFQYVNSDCTKLTTSLPPSCRVWKKKRNGTGLKKNIMVMTQLNCLGLDMEVTFNLYPHKCLRNVIKHLYGLKTSI